MISQKIYLGLFALLFFCTIYVHQKNFDGPTPASRLDLLHTLFIQGKVSINAYHENTPDKAIFGDNYYSDKAPGIVVLALAPFAVAGCALSLAGIELDSKTGWLFSSWVACLGSIGILTAVGGVVLFSWLSKYVSLRSALVATLALFLGGAPLPYATMMFSHSLVIGMLAIAIWAADPFGALVQGRFGNGKRFDFKGNDELTFKSRCSHSDGSVHKRDGLTMIGRFRRWAVANRWDLLAGFSSGWVLARACPNWTIF